MPMPRSCTASTLSSFADLLSKRPCVRDATWFKLIANCSRLALRATTLGLRTLLGADHHVRGDGKDWRTTDHQRRTREEPG